MRKTFLTIGVVLVFSIYAIYQRMGLSNLNVTPAPTPTPTEVPNPTPIPTPVTPAPTPTPTQVGQYKDGTYTGDPITFLYGVMQVKATISLGKLTNVTFLKFPNDRDTSIQINTEAMPILKAEAIKSQNSKVDIVSGATDSSIAFGESLATALSLAKN